MGREKVKVVFIAGSSYSGSTMLGLVLGSDDRAFFSGEVKQYMRRRDPKHHQAPGHYFCTCGERYEECPFWKSVHARYGSERNLNPAPGFSWSNLRLVTRVLIPLKRGDDRPIPEHARLLETIHDVARADEPVVVCVVDSSKSVRTLDALADASNLDLHVIHLIRDGRAVTSSFKSRGWNSFYGMVSWAMVNAFLALYLRRNSIRSVRVDYASLCLSTTDELDRINAFLGLSLKPEELTRRVRENAYHVFGGNKDVRGLSEEFQGVRFRADREQLNAVERIAAALLVAPLNRWFGIMSPVAQLATDAERG
jgi:hypothetical protein